jgi:hypothetical protein
MRYYLGHHSTISIIIRCGKKRDSKVKSRGKERLGGISPLDNVN